MNKVVLVYETTHGIEWLAMDEQPDTVAHFKRLAREGGSRIVAVIRPREDFILRTAS